MTYVLKIKNTVIRDQAMSYPLLLDEIDIFEKKIEVGGVPQIDYKIQRDKLIKKLNYPLIFRKQRRW